jgi:predicted negative regulator of RcsB-dependent stress response/peroxiredoxin
MIRHRLHRQLAAVAMCAAAMAQGAPAVGDTAPALRGKDAAGRELSWDAFAGRAVILFFHSQDMSYSNKGLDAVCRELAAAEDLKDKAALVVITNGERDIGSLQQMLDASKLPGAIAVDPDRTMFSGYHVVAYPTVCSVTAERKVAHLTKGYGPLIGSKVVAGSRLAAGLLDEQGLHQALSRAEIPPDSEQTLKTARSVRMAEQLFASGMLDEARNSLQQALKPDTRSKEGIALLARILLAQGRRDDASPWLDRLAALAPNSVELRQLRAEHTLQGGDAEAALQLLDGVEDKSPRTALIRGRALERMQRWKEAAEVYRKALGAVEQAK